MEQYAIKGGNPLVGEVEIGGAKNAALPILAASVMTDETVYIENMPDVRDTNVLLSAMENIGVIVKRTDRHKVTLNASNISELVVEDENIKKIRASYYLIGALLGKYKHAEVALPGGCDIGCRAIDQHIKGFRALGADVKIEHGLILSLIHISSLEVRIPRSLMGVESHNSSNNAQASSYRRFTEAVGMSIGIW